MSQFLKPIALLLVGSAIIGACAVALAIPMGFIL